MIRFPRPAVGEVHIRCISHDPDALRTDRREDLLSRAERERSEGLLTLRARNQFVTGRIFMREVIGGYLGIGPESVALALSEHGKPFLREGSGPGDGLDFNLSHSGELILLAVTAGHRVGIDLELMRDDIPIEKMARIAFSAYERRELSSLAPDLRLAAFFRCWTRKEAYLKGCGHGFRLPCDSFDVSLLPDDPPTLRNRLDPCDCPSAWQLFDIAVPDGYCSALAVEFDGPVQLSFPEAIAA